MVVRQHVLEVYASAGSPVTISFGTGDTLYYKADPSVSTTSYDATLTTNQSVTISAPTWIVSGGRSYIGTTDESVSHGLTPFAQTVLASGSASAARSVLGLGTISTQDSSNVSVTGGAVTGITDVAVADGGTGGSTAATARSNLGVGDVDNITVTTASTAVSATTFTTRSSAPASTGLVAIDVGSVNCEVRRISSVSGSTVTVSTALSNAHSSGVKVYFFHAAVDPAWWGAKGDASTDDEPALQAALRSISVANLINQSGSSLPLDGSGRTYVIKAPLMIPNQSVLQRLSIFAHASYAPADTNAAMLMAHRTTPVSFTAVASTDTFTTPAAHGLVVGVQVVLKPDSSASMPAGVTAGRIYYIKTVPTTTTFTLSTLADVSDLVDVTSDGTGYAYGTLQGQCRLYMRGVRVQALGAGGNVNGIKAALQQPSSFFDVRVEAARYGIWISGQQAPFYNTQLLTCNVGLALDAANFFWFYGFNVEQCTVANVKVMPDLGGSASFSGRAAACGFWGVHFEQSGSEFGFDLAGPADTFTMDNVETGGDLLWAHGGGATLTNYRLRNVRVRTSEGATLIQDDDRSFTRTAHANDYIEEFNAPIQLSDGTADDVNKYEIRLQNGGYLKYGAVRLHSNLRETRPPTSHDGKQELWRTDADVAGSWVSHGGYFGTSLNAAPADAELVAGDAAVWFDKTNSTPSVNWKAKQADGTVKTGKLPLFTAADTTAQSTTASTQTTPWGFASQAQADAIATHLNDIRTCLRNAGLMA